MLRDDPCGEQNVEEDDDDDNDEQDVGNRIGADRLQRPRTGCQGEDRGRLELRKAASRYKRHYVTSQIYFATDYIDRSRSQISTSMPPSSRHEPSLSPTPPSSILGCFNQSPPELNLYTTHLRYSSAGCAFPIMCITLIVVTSPPIYPHIDP